jgi:hypothetical protein
VKIALIHPTAPPVPGTVEDCVGEQIRLLREGGHCVSLASYEGGDSCQADCRIPLSREASRKALLLYLEAALASSDVVVFHNLGTMPDAPELTAALRELPRRIPSARWICWVHQMACLDPLYVPFGDPEIAFWMSTPCSDWEYVADSALCARQVRDAFGVPCTLLSAGVDCASRLGLSPEMRQLTSAFRVWDSDLILLNPTPLRPRRGHETCLAVLEALRAQSLRPLLILGGDTPDSCGRGTPDSLSELLSTRSALGLDARCLLAGRDFEASPDALRQWLRIADALLLPSPPPRLEPLLWDASLHGICVFHPDSFPSLEHPASVVHPARFSPKQTAEWLIQQMGLRDTIQARRLARGQHRWAASAQKSLASFLEKPHNWKTT